MSFQLQRQLSATVLASIDFCLHPLFRTIILVLESKRKLPASFWPTLHPWPRRHITSLSRQPLPTSAPISSGWTRLPAAPGQRQPGQRQPRSCHCQTQLPMPAPVMPTPALVIPTRPQHHTVGPDSLGSLLPIPTPWTRQQPALAPDSTEALNYDRYQPWIHADSSPSLIRADSSVGLTGLGF